MDAAKDAWDVSSEMERSEPSLGELMRGIARIEKSLNEYRSDAITAAVFALEKKALDDKIIDNRSRIVELEGKIVGVNTELDNYKATVEDQRGKMRLMIYGLVGTPLVTLLVTFITNGGLQFGP